MLILQKKKLLADIVIETTSPINVAMMSFGRTCAWTSDGRYFMSITYVGRIIKVVRCDLFTGTSHVIECLADLKNQPIVSLSVTHILQFYGYFKGQEQFGFNPTSWHLVTYNFL